MLNNTTSSSWQYDLRFFPSYVFTAMFVTYVLLFPLFVLVLYVGFRRWRRRRSGALSHSDVFTFHMVALELAAVLGSYLICHALRSVPFSSSVLEVGMHLWALATPGHILLHLFTCVERYLAVVHPVTYRGLRRSWGVRIRNGLLGYIWMVCLVYPSLLRFPLSYALVNILSVLLSSVLTCFCSLFVLHVLNRAGPGRGQAERADRSKRQAFKTMVVIKGALLLKFSSTAVILTASVQPSFSPAHYWSMVCYLSWCSVPSSLVLPLLFLNKAGTLRLCRPRCCPARDPDP